MKKNFIALLLLCPLLAQSMQIYSSPPVMQRRVCLPTESMRLPPIIGDHPTQKAARNFLATQKIFDINYFNYTLTWLDNNNACSWMSVATAFRHAQDRKAHELAIIIYTKIFNNICINNFRKSLAAMGLSKIYFRISDSTKSQNFAREAVLFDPTNGFAWHRLGDVLIEGYERAKAYSEALKCARTHENSNLAALAYYGLGHVCETEKRGDEARDYYELSLRAQPNYEAAQRGLLRLKY